MNVDAVGQMSAGGRGCAPRLLVVDPREESRRRVADYFRARGYDILLAADGVEALVRTILPGVDVVIMSATLPGLEGYEAAAIVRRIRPRTRIILTSGADLEARPREREHREVFPCFPVPLDLDSIAQAIESAGQEPEVAEARTEEGTE